MEGVIETQHQIMEEMHRILTNFKKDGASRKTPEGIRKKLDHLDNYWAEFQNNHQKICEREDPSHKYFLQETYEQTRQFYESTRELFIKYLTQEQKQPAPISKPVVSTDNPVPTTSKSSEPKLTHESGAGGVKHGIQSPFSIKMPEVAETASNNKTEEMLRKQRSNIKAFQRTTANINVDLLKENWQFEDALKMLETRWKAVDSLYWDLDSLVDEVDVQYEMSYNTCELI